MLDNQKRYKRIKVNGFTVLVPEGQEETPVSRDSVSTPQYRPTEPAVKPTGVPLKPGIGSSLVGDLLTRTEEIAENLTPSEKIALGKGQYSEMIKARTGPENKPLRRGMGVLTEADKVEDKQIEKLNTAGLTERAGAFGQGALESLPFGAGRVAREYLPPNEYNEAFAAQAPPAAQVVGNIAKGTTGMLPLLLTAPTSVLANIGLGAASAAGDVGAEMAFGDPTGWGEGATRVASEGLLFGAYGKLGGAKLFKDPKFLGKLGNFTAQTGGMSTVSLMSQTVNSAIKKAESQGLDIDTALYEAAMETADPQNILTTLGQFAVIHGAGTYNAGKEAKKLKAMEKPKAPDVEITPEANILALDAQSPRNAQKIVKAPVKPKPEPDNIISANPHDRAKVNEIKIRLEQAVRKGEKFDDSGIGNLAEELTSPSEIQRLQEVYQRGLDHNRDFDKAIKAPKEVKQPKGEMRTEPEGYEIRDGQVVRRSEIKPPATEPPKIEAERPRVETVKPPSELAQAEAAIKPEAPANTKVTKGVEILNNGKTLDDVAAELGYNKNNPNGRAMLKQVEEAFNAQPEETRTQAQKFQEREKFVRENPTEAQGEAFGYLDKGLTGSKLTKAMGLPETRQNGEKSIEWMNKHKAEQEARNRKLAEQDPALAKLAKPIFEGEEAAKAEQVNRLTEEAIDTANLINDSRNKPTPTQEKKLIKEGEKIAAELRARGIKAEFKSSREHRFKHKLFIDGKPVNKRSAGLVSKTEKVPVKEMEFDEGARKPFKSLTAEEKETQLFIAKNLVDASDLPDGYGDAAVRKGVDDLIAGKDTDEARLVRQATIKITREGKDVPRTSTNDAEYLSPDDIKQRMDEDKQAKKAEAEIAEARKKAGITDEDLADNELPFSRDMGGKRADDEFTAKSVELINKVFPDVEFVTDSKRVEAHRKANSIPDDVLAWIDSDNKTVYLSGKVKKDSPFHEVFGHAFFTHVEKTNPVLHKKILTNMEDALSTDSALRERLQRDYPELFRRYEQGDKSAFLDEVWANIIGKKMVDYADWKNMSPGVKKVYRRIAMLADEYFKAMRAFLARQYKIRIDPGKDIRKFTVQDFVNKTAKGVMKGGQIRTGDGQTQPRFQIAGESSLKNLPEDERKVRQGNLETADAMTKAGKDAKTVWMATGWERGADKKWRYEIPEFTLNRKVQSIIEPIIGQDLNRDLGTLGDVISGELLSAYPELKHITIGTGRMTDETAAFMYTGKYGAAHISVAMDRVTDTKHFKSVLTHEVQHAIQRIEGFAGGSSPVTEGMFLETKEFPPKVQEEIKKIEQEIESLKERQKELQEVARKIPNEEKGYGRDKHNALWEELESIIPKTDKLFKSLSLLKRPYLNEIGLEKYKKSAGETEARNAQTRAGMTAEERKNTPLSETEDVARDKQIVRFQRSIEEDRKTTRFSPKEAIKRNGGYTLDKAPNGKESILFKSVMELPEIKGNKAKAERFVAQVYSDKFKQWFGDWQSDPKNASKVVDENGMPLLVEHGSRGKFTVFDINKAGKSSDTAKLGFWFSSTKGFGEKFVKGIWYGDSKRPLIYNVFLDIKNPKIYETKENNEQAQKLKSEIKSLENKAKEIEDKYTTGYYDWQERQVFTYAAGFFGDVLAKKRDYYANRTPKSAEAIRDGETVKRLNDKIKNIEKEYYKLHYSDAYEQLKTDIYELADKTARDANVGGLGMMLDDHHLFLKQFKDNTIKEGHDGIIIKNTRFDSQDGVGVNSQYLAFDNLQIKSVFNKGKFSESNPDIRFQKAEEAGANPNRVEEAKRLWAEKGTDSPFFKKWFRGSKVVDEQGKPMVVYHGSPSDFNIFDIDKVGAQGSTEGHGFYFTPAKHIAEGYSTARGNGKLFEVYLDIKKPYSNDKRTISKTDLQKILIDLNEKNPEALSNYGDIGYEGFRKVLAEAVQSENSAVSDTDLIGSLYHGGIATLDEILASVYKITGKDGVITKWAGKDGIETPIYIATRPEQIKSATGNQGTFDGGNPDIRFERNPQDKQQESATVKRLKLYEQQLIGLESKAAKRELAITRKKIYREENRLGAVPEGDIKPSQTKGYNKRTANPAIAEDIAMILDGELRESFDKNRNYTVTNEQTLKEGAKLAETLTDDDIMSLEPGTIKNSTEATGYRIYTEARMVQAKRDMEANTNPATRLNYQKAAVMYMKMRSLGTEGGRLVQSFAIPMSDEVINTLRDARKTFAEIDPVLANDLDAILDEAKIKMSTQEAKAVAESVKQIEALKAELEKQFEVSKADQQKIKELEDLINGLKKVQHDAVTDFDADIKPVLRQTIKKVKDPALRNHLRKVIAKNIKKPGWGDYVRFWYINSLLSNPMTHAVNFSSNLMHIGAEGIPMMLMNPTQSGQMIAGAWRGFKRGKAKYSEIMKGKAQDSKFIDNPGMYDPDFGKGNWVIPTKHLTASDALFREIAKGMYGGKEGKMAKKYKTDIRGLEDMLKSYLTDEKYREWTLEKSTEGSAVELAQLADDMEKFAKYVVFQSDLGRFGKATQNLSKSITFVLPFVKTPANIFKVAKNFSPLGFGKLYGKKAAELSVRERQDFTRRAIVGTMFYTAIGSALAAGLIDITGEEPRDQRVRDLWKRLGYEPFKIYFGNTGFDYRNISPVNIGLMAIGNWKSQMTYDKPFEGQEKEFIQELSTTILATAKGFTNQSYLSGLSSLMAKIREPETGADYLYDAALSMTPSAARLGKQMFGDDTQYQTDGFMDKVEQRFDPSPDLLPRRDVFGEIKKSSYQRLPIPTVEKLGEKDGRGIEKFLLENELLVGYPSKATKIYDGKQGESRKMTAEEYDRYLEISGKEIRKRLEENLEQLKKIPADEAEKQIKRIVDTEREIAKYIIEGDVK